MLCYLCSLCVGDLTYPFLINGRTELHRVVCRCCLEHTHGLHHPTYLRYKWRPNIIPWTSLHTLTRNDPDRSIFLLHFSTCGVIVSGYLRFPGLDRVVWGAGAAYRWSRWFILLELTLRVGVGLLNITVWLHSETKGNNADA